MLESFLTFIWQFKYFDVKDLTTSAGEPIVLKHPGFLNKDAGPDFKGAKICIGELEWNGDIEMHVKSSDWLRHQHQHDMAYNSVILHVVWEDDAVISRQDGTKIPVLVLKDRVDAALLGRFQQLVESRQPILCASQIQEVNELSKLSMLDKAVIDRLRRKARGVLDLLDKAAGDWETTAYWLLAQNFGFKVNNETFLKLAQQLPLKVIAKHRDQLLQLEALLFGVAGFLEEFNAESTYEQELVREWNFLSQKYDLKEKQLQRHEWKFLRLRPANFPTIRIAQFAALLSKQYHLFSLFKNTTSSKELIKVLKQIQSDYWQKHYDVGKPSKSPIKGLGAASIQNTLINTAAPLLAAYGIYTDEEKYLDQATELLQHVSAEENHIIDQWKEVGIEAKTAFDSQALIELFNEYCQPKKCLSCTIGVKLIKSGK